MSQTSNDEGYFEGSCLDCKRTSQEEHAATCFFHPAHVEANAAAAEQAIYDCCKQCGGFDGNHYSSCIRRSRGLS